MCFGGINLEIYKIWIKQLLFTSTDSVKAFLQKNKLGKYNEEEQARIQAEKEAAEKAEQDKASTFNVGDRCEVRGLASMSHYIRQGRKRGWKRHKTKYCWLWFHQTGYSSLYDWNKCRVIMKLIWDLHFSIVIVFIVLPYGNIGFCTFLMYI